MYLHENLCPGFDGLEFCPAVKISRDLNAKGFQNECEIRIIDVHEPEQIIGKLIYFPFVQCFLDPFRTHPDVPVDIVFSGKAGITKTFLYDTHQYQGNHANEEMGIDVFGRPDIDGPGLKVSLYDAELVFDCYSGQRSTISSVNKKKSAACRYL